MSSASSEFEPLSIRDGALIARVGDLEVLGALNEPIVLSGGATHFGLIASGVAVIGGEGFDARLTGPSSFACAEPLALRPGGACFIISVHGYRGITQLGPRLEQRGRLRYIDGCTDTLVVCPPRLGEPCLNHLHIPPHTRQSSHVHPSVRLGIIARGRGRCVTPAGEYELEPGLGWRIPAGLVHAFVTGDEALDVLAWHPDSDFGPTDEAHPMINRTYLDGVSGAREPG